MTYTERCNIKYRKISIYFICVIRAGIETEVHAMETTRFLDQEDNYPVWSTADTYLEYPSMMLSRYASTYTAFQVMAELANRWKVVSC